MAKKYIGIDISDKYAMISYYMHGMSEPGTFSMVTGSEIYQIPVCISQKKDTGKWLCGEEARRYARENGAPCAEGLLRKALSGESVEFDKEGCSGQKLLFCFLKLLLGLLVQLGEGERPDRLAITAENMNLELRTLFRQFADFMQLPQECLLLLDYRESFYYYAYSQPFELCVHDTALFYFTTKKLLLWRLSRDRKTIPQVVTIAEEHYRAILENRDREFTEIVKKAFQGRFVSAVYLIGSGFDGGWMKKSLSAVCMGRRAFMGKNLFSKGACYAAAVKAERPDWPYIYMGDDEIKMNVSLKVENEGETQLLTLIMAGDNWYEAYGECEVILNGSPSVDFWLCPPGDREGTACSVELTGMPAREDKTTRLRITVRPEAADRLCISIRDMGFGEFVKSSEKVWEQTVTL